MTFQSRQLTRLRPCSPSGLLAIGIDSNTYLSACTFYKTKISTTDLRKCTSLNLKLKTRASIALLGDIHICMKGVLNMSRFCFER